MKPISVVLIVIVLGGLGFYFLEKQKNVPAENIGNDGNGTSTQNAAQADKEVFLDNLEIPWDIAFLPSGEMLVAQRPGKLLFIAKDKKRTEIKIEGVKHSGEGGLLGIVLHPNFKENHFIYLYLSSGYSLTQTRNRVERYKLDSGALADKKIIIENIPGSLYHDGGRMEFGSDGKLYITTGDATQGKIAQDLNSLGGKILRLNDDGSVPDDNPFHNAVWSYGHRNPQGLAWDEKGNLWETEHGPTGESGLCCRDEINLITKGGNYGWPEITGDQAKDRMIAPVFNSGTNNTWAPASLLYYKGSLFFGGLKGEALYEAVLDGTKVKELKIHFKNEFGRIRSIRLGPDGMFYITTSNRDGRGKPKSGDDKIIRINPAGLK